MNPADAPNMTMKIPICIPVLMLEVPSFWGDAALASLFMVESSIAVSDYLRSLISIVIAIELPGTIVLRVYTCMSYQVVY